MGAEGEVVRLLDEGAKGSEEERQLSHQRLCVLIAKYERVLGSAPLEQRLQRAGGRDAEGSAEASLSTRARLWMAALGVPLFDGLSLRFLDLLGGCCCGGASFLCAGNARERVRVSTSCLPVRESLGAFLSCALAPLAHEREDGGACPP